MIRYDTLLYENKSAALFKKSATFQLSGAVRDGPRFIKKTKALRVLQAE